MLPAKGQLKFSEIFDMTHAHEIARIKGLSICNGIYWLTKY